MKVTNLTIRKLRKLDYLPISNKVYNTEGYLYLYKSKSKYKSIEEVLKIYYDQTNEKVVDKINLITRLSVLFEDLNFEELVLPSSLVAVDDEIVGFAMPYIKDNINLTLFLKNPKIKLEIKLKYLKEILALLKKIKENPKLKDKFFLHDIHEANFILDKSDQKVKAIADLRTVLN